MTDFTGHTPGPWHEKDYALKVEIHSENGKFVATVHSRDCESPEEMKANARLVAAAPDLLVKRDRLRKALDHALKGDLDPEDRVIIAQILDGTVLQEAEG